MTVIAIAPMLDWTDRHYRYFMRQLTKHTELYTEMIVADAILHGNVERLLGFNKVELPLILQLGGSDPKKLAGASCRALEYGYSGINLNVGCPSDRVKSGNFGACLMRDKHLVASCIKAMQDAVDIPISIKHRTGLDYNYDYDFLHDFISMIADTGCNRFIIHARNAVLSGLSPKQNREIPPLRYDFVYRLKQDFPQLEIIINGGIKTTESIQEHLKHIDGVMLGREAYYNPYLFASFDQLFYTNKSQGITVVRSREEIAMSMLPYLEQCVENNIYLHHITRHMIGLYHGCPNAKIWRYTMTNEIIKTNDIRTYTDLLDKFVDRII
ncbi:MAG: tRNA dihydrouridine(20/20a) synthase DusA [Burkholderiales bacterium]|jgi:tRNA-dihydrouridine synthase A|nr:tRNA dihydrouridine(20/20a) synthase DusA [Burkholderiales bacterium]